MTQLGKAFKGKAKDKAAKKGKAGGEEKVLQDKLKRMEEMDYRKRLAKQLRAELTMKLEAEQRNSKINKMRIQNQWRKILRLAKVESLRKEIEVLSQTHERDVDRKDAIIQMLDRDLEEAEEQYQMALRSHLQNIDALIDLQDARLLALENEFERDLSTLEDEFKAEREQIVKQHQLEKSELLDIMAAVDAREKAHEAETKTEHDQIREESRNKTLEQIQELRIDLHTTIDELERHFESAHLNYLQNTDQRTQDFKNLTRMDKESHRLIRRNVKKIEKLQKSRASWIAKINQNKKECEERNRALKEEKNQILQHFQALKTRMNRFRAAQSKRLAALSTNARKAMASLEEKKALAERILKLSEFARKLESEREKVLPAYESSLEPESRREVEAQARMELEQAGIKAGATKGGAAEAAAAAEHGTGVHADGTPVEEAEYLDNFFRKYNKVLLDKLAIEKERNRLHRENADLQAILKQYLDGIAVSEDVMSAPNPLLVVNGRVNLNAPPVRHAVKPTVVEASHMISSHRVRT